MKNIGLSSLILLCSGIILINSGCSNVKESKPNVILIMVDDLGAESITAYGGESYSTPYIDHLAETGIRFTNAYSTPLCTPTRVQLMTGQYPFRNGWKGGIWNKPVSEQFLDPDLFNFARIFKDKGYKTAVAGKWQLARFNDHPDHPQKLGFDEHCLWTWKYPGIPPESGIRMEGENKPSRFWDPGVWKNSQLMKNTEQDFGPDIYTEFILNFIEKNKQDPFFIYYPMALTHWPFVPVPGVGGNKDGTRENPEGQAYFSGMVHYTDRIVGEILRKLTMLGIRENTMVIFTGDNGNAQSLESQYKGQRIKGGKSEMNEAGTRVPFIVNWPGGITRSKVLDDMVDLADIVPTFADITNYKLPQSMTFDGESILPVVYGDGKLNDQWVFCQQGDQWLIRNKSYRLHQDGKFYKMDDRYEPKQLSGNLSEEVQAQKQNLQETIKAMMP